MRTEKEALSAEDVAQRDLLYGSVWEGGMVDAARVRLLHDAVWDRDMVGPVERFRITDYGEWSRFAALLTWHDAARPDAPVSGSERVASLVDAIRELRVRREAGMEWVRKHGRDAMHTAEYKHRFDVSVWFYSFGSQTTNAEFSELVAPSDVIGNVSSNDAVQILSGHVLDRDHEMVMELLELQRRAIQIEVNREAMENAHADAFFSQFAKPYTGMSL